MQTIIDDTPEGSLVPPALPDKPAQQLNVPQSFELEGEWNVSTSSNGTFTNDQADVSEESECVEDTLEAPMKFRNRIEHARERSEQGEE